jgi:hypothetical protein
MGEFQVIIESVLYVIPNQQPLLCSPKIRLCQRYMIIFCPNNFYPQPLFPEPNSILESANPIEEILNLFILANTSNQSATLTNNLARLTKKADQIVAQSAM